MTALTLAEGAWYRHTEYGRVEALTVTDNHVGFLVDSTGRAESQARAAFVQAADPAPVTISPPPTRTTLDTNPPGN